MAVSLTLAIDQGTTASKAVVFDAAGRPVAVAREPIETHRPKPDFAEQDAHRVLASVHGVLARVLENPDVEAAAIGHAGLATQRSSIVAWDAETGEPLSPVLSWQDRRGLSIIEGWQQYADWIAGRTGLRLSPYYGASKMRWLLDHHPDVQQAFGQGRLSIGPLAAFLVHHLARGGPLLVDVTNASRTLLCGLQSRDWDAAILDRFGIDAAILPRCRPVQSDYGLLDSIGAPLTAVSGDQNAAVFGDGWPDPGTAVVNIGTGAFVLAVTGNEANPVNGLLCSVLSSDASSAGYAVEGTVNGAGAALEWLGDRYTVPADHGSWQAALETVANPPVFVNAVGGLGSPWWRAGAQPRFIGATEPDDQQALVAVLESIVFLLQANIAAMQAGGVGLRQIRISGGLSQIDGLCQRLADLSGLPVLRPEMAEATARGIAWLAARPGLAWSMAAPRQFEPRTSPALTARFRQLLDAIG